MSGLIKQIARLLFRDYSIYRIYGYTGSGTVSTSDVGTPARKFRFEVVMEGEIRHSSDELIAQQAWYHGQGAYAYACFQDSRIVGLCFFWHGDRYAERNFWPLSGGEAKLVQLIVLPELRGCGIGRDLVKFAANDMFRQGYKHLYSRIWWSNIPSLRVFEHAGWQPVATVIELCIRGRHQPFKFHLMKRSS